MSPRPTSAAVRSSTLDRIANTPKVPCRLSRMIASFSSRSRPPKNPSAVSARPSSCNAPVKARPASTDKSAAGQSPRPTSWASRKANAATAPIPAPTSGKAQAESAICQVPRAGVATGTLVKKAVATAKPANNPGGRRRGSSGALIAATIPEGCSRGCAFPLGLASWFRHDPGSPTEGRSPWTNRPPTSMRSARS